MVNLKSSVEKQGKFVTQIIIFSGGNKKTYRNIDTSTIEQGEFTKFILKDGRMILVNTKNVDIVEVFKQDGTGN